MEEIAAFTPPVADALLALLPSNGIAGAKQSVLSSSDTTNIFLAFTTGGATARSGSTCGTGTATLYEIDDSNALASVGNTFDFVNLAQAAVGANKYILLARVSGKLVCIWEEC